MAKLNIDDELSTVDACIDTLSDLITATTVSMLDDSAGTYDLLKGKLDSAKTKLDTARSNLSAYNETLKNNTNSDDWYLKYDSYNG